MIPLYKCNPFVRTAMIQSAVMEGDRARTPFDQRLFLVYEGNAVIILNGTEIPVKRNTLIYLGINDEYYFRGKIRAAVINFDMTMSCCDRKKPICPVPKSEYDESLIFDAETAEGFESPIVLTADENLKNGISRLTEIFIRGGSQADTLASAHLKEILATVLSEKNSFKNEKQLLVQRLSLYIKENAANISGNREIGEAFGYHPVYLAELFKAETGRTLHSEITAEKLRIASRLLIYTNNSVEDISASAGFSSRNHFCTVFKGHFGVTPLVYRSSRAVSQL